MFACGSTSLPQRDLRDFIGAEIDRKLSFFSEAFKHKLKELDDIFQSVDERQARIERKSKVQDEEIREMLLTSFEVLRDKLAVSHNTVSDSEKRGKVLDTELRALTNKVERMENLLLTERERVDHLQQISGLSMIDVERKMDLKEEEVETRIGNLSFQLDDLKATMENVHDKMYDFGNSRKNNLIFYGIPREERENGKTLMIKIKSLITTRLNIKRYIGVSSAARLLTGHLQITSKSQ